MTETVTLYQFELCPYCHKVRAGLDLKGIGYERVDVSPMNKKELPKLPEDAPKKVPVLKVGDRIVYDSTDILEYLDEVKPEQVPFIPKEEAAAAKSREIEQWVDDELTFSMPTVIYGTWGEAAKAAQVTARTSNFGLMENLAVRAGGSLIMHQVAKRILAKRNKTDAHAWMAENLDRVEAWLGDADFLGGDAPDLADAAVHGAVTCMAEFPAFTNVQKRPKLLAWYQRVADLRAQNRPN
ncbi:MAG: glutathione S-transferase family protein [Deltaproteobacteria bacterium]